MRARNQPNGWLRASNQPVGSLLASIASIHSAKENGVVAKLAKTFAYIGAESDGHGHWKWDDGSKWWQPDDEDTDGLWGHSDTRIAAVTLARRRGPPMHALARCDAGREAQTGDKFA